MPTATVNDETKGMPTATVNDETEGIPTTTVNAEINKSIISESKTQRPC